MNSESFDKEPNSPLFSDKENAFYEALQQEPTNTREALIQDTEQQVQQKKDPRTKPDGGGFRGAVKEVQSALSGGLQDTFSSLATFPERTVDALSGEMQRERKEKGYYRPDWSPFTDYENPIVTNTWWGSLLRGTVHFGTMAVGVTAAAGAAGISAPASLTGVAGYSLLRAAGIGAVADMLSKETDGHNALAMMRDRHGWMDTPLSTKDTDHPMWMKFKNIVEGMGIGMVFDGATMLLGRGSGAVKNQVKNRKSSIEYQTLKKGIRELRKNEFGASKNKSSASPHQGAHQSEVSPGKAREQLKRTREEWDAEDGSTGSVTTPVQRERVAETGEMTEEIVDGVLRGLMSDQKFQRELADIRAGRQTLMDVYGDAVATHQRMTLGREAAEMAAEDYLDEMYRSAIKYDITDDAGNVVETIETWTTKNIVAGDLVVGSLLKQLRDNGIAGRELADFVNLIEKDGPMQQVFDTMMTAMTEIKRARAWSSDSFRGIGAGKIGRKQAIEDAVKADMKDTKDAILSILQISKDDGNDDLLNATFELFSAMKTVNNLDDFDAFCRKMIKGGQLEPGGPDRTGALLREMEGMMVHSVLSGPKTAMRAVMGTSTATFLRPMSTVIGATLRGDAATMRSGLASMNAMMQAIPESFEIFKTKLNSYWSGDVSSMKTRFSEFTKGDENWELLRRWAEDSGRATAGERAMFAMANQARNWNNNSWLTYSTKLMAATDDAFRHILGRTKMREKAVRSALDAQSKGLITDVNPALIGVFEEDFYRQIFDADGNLIDEATKFAAKEVTLTQELTGFSKGLNDVFTANPWAKPFFLFARTGVNGLALTAKHTPGFNFLVKEFNDIAFASIKDLETGKLSNYGITNAAELANAKALQTGRLAMGSSLVGLASWSWMNGNMSGNGPVDRQTRQLWLDLGWKPRSLKIGDVWISYDSVEPFNQTWSMIADIGDASQLMGEEWTENQLQKISLIVAQGVASKSYLQGMQLWVDAFGGQPGSWGRVGSSLINNTVPLASLRNEMGKIFTPHQRELSSSIWDAIRNRNLTTEHIAGNHLPIKYDLFTDKPLKDYDFMTRVAKGVLPFEMNLDYSQGVKMLLDSDFDLRIITYTAPDGTDLSKHPELLSIFKRELGKLQMGVGLDRLARRKDMIDSIALADSDKASGYRGDFEPRDYHHNKVYKAFFDENKKIAWINSLKYNIVQQEVAKQAREKENRKLKQFETTPSFQQLLAMYK